MQTLHPSIIPGAYKYDPEVLPEDEFRARIDHLKEVMDANNLAAALVYGDAREHAALAYYSNFIPRNRWGLAMLPRIGEPRLLASVATRSVPAQRPMTWIADLQSGWDFQKTFDPWIAALDGAERRGLGTIGFEIAAPPLYELIVSGTRKRGYSLQPVDLDIAEHLERKRPRELVLLKKACLIVNGAIEAWRTAWHNERSALPAALTAERVARAMAAQDVRLLISTDGGETLEPFQSGIEIHSSVVLGYLAVKYMGVWADAFVTARPAPSPALATANRGLDAMLRHARPGVTGGELYATMKQQLGSYRMHDVLCGSVGQPIGLSLYSENQFLAESTSPLQDQGVYTFRSGVSGTGNDHAIISAMVLVVRQGAEVLCRTGQ